MLLAHGSGLADYRWMEPGGRLRIHTDPGERYAYSSEGYAILQLIVEQGLGLDVAQEMRRRVFDRFGMIPERVAQCLARAVPVGAMRRGCS